MGSLKGGALFFCYDHINNVSRNTQLLYTQFFCFFWLPRSDTVYPRSFQKVTIVALFHLNCTKGHIILTQLMPGNQLVWREMNEKWGPRKAVSVLTQRSIRNGKREHASK